MTKYIQLLKNHFGVAFDSRANLITSLAQDLIILLGPIFLWLSIFQKNNNIAGFSQKTILFYYILTPFVGFITRVYISNDLSNDIKNGIISNKLIKPYSISLDAITSSIAGQINFFIFVFPVYIILFASLIITKQSSITNIIIGIVFCILGYIFSFILDLPIAWLAFYLDEVWAFRHIKNIIFINLGGLSFPLDFVGSNLRWLFDFLPFKYIYYIPVSYINGSRGPEYIFNDLIELLLWCLFLIILGNILWKNGIKKYGAFGN